MSESRELEKVTLNLYKGDMERVRAAAGSRLASLVIRNVVAAFLERVESQMTPAGDALKEIGIDGTVGIDEP